MNACCLGWLMAMTLLVACSRSKNAANAPLASLPQEPASHPPRSFEQGASTSEATRPSALDGTPLEDPSPGKKSERDEAQKPRSPIDLSTVEIRLERTECFGTCPNYTVVIAGDGHVHYVGRTYVSVVGERDSTISADVIHDLLGRFDKAQFFDLKNEYAQAVTDLPSTYLSLTIGGRSKRVRNYWVGADDSWGDDDPDRTVHLALDSIADAIDQAVHVEQWIGQ